jgi:hypothetical protein
MRSVVSEIRTYRITYRHRMGLSSLDDMPTENSVRINPHSCGTLIADLVDALMHFPSTGISAFRLQEGKRRCNRLVPAKQRSAGIDGVIPRPVESLPRAPVPAVPLPWAPGRLCPRLNAYGTADSRQNSCAAFGTTISHSTR